LGAKKVTKPIDKGQNKRKWENRRWRTNQRVSFDAMHYEFKKKKKYNQNKKKEKKREKEKTKEKEKKKKKALRQWIIS